MSIDLLPEILREGGIVGGVIFVLVLTLLVVFKPEIIAKFNSSQRFGLLLLLVVAALVAAFMDGYFKHQNKLLEVNARPQPKWLALTLHELGNQQLRTLYSQGRVEISDSLHRQSAPIDKYGQARFDSVGDWVFARQGVKLGLLHVDQDTDYLYRLLADIHHFEPNDTFFIPIASSPVAPMPTPDVVSTGQSGLTSPQSDHIRLRYARWNDGQATYSPFTFSGRRTLAELKAHVLEKFNVLASMTPTPTKVWLAHGPAGADHIELTEENQTLAEFGLAENEAIWVVAVRTIESIRFKPVTLVIAGSNLQQPRISINNVPAALAEGATATRVVATGSLGTLAADSCSVRIQNGSDIYLLRLPVRDTIRINLRRYSPIDMRRIRQTLGRGISMRRGEQ